MVGRAVARLDWNLDRKPDLAIGLLDTSSILLTNSSETADNRSVILRLVATKSARDAIGTTVTASIDQNWIAERGGISARRDHVNMEARVGIRRHRFDRTFFGFIYRAVFGCHSKVEMSGSPPVRNVG